MTTRKSSLLAGLVSLAIITGIPVPSVQAQAAAPAAPRIEVAFVLDTTGSMGGLIEGAKQKIWYIANQIIAAKPTPKIKIALVGYRDVGDEYVTKSYDLSDDIDGVYGHLRSFSASGGGDSPESVNRALDEAVNKLNWSGDTAVLKIIYLVGDYPPHMDYQETKYPEILQQAVRKDLIVNTIQCGAVPETATVWQDIAKRAEGKYVAIGQTGNMQIVATPMDKRIAELNGELNRTVLSYGSVTMRAEVADKLAASEAAPAPVMAERMKFNSLTRRSVQGGGDLLDALKSGEVELERMKETDLPAELRDKSIEEQRTYVTEQERKRAGIQAELTSLLKERDEYMLKEQRRLAEQGKGSAFDSEVIGSLREQAKKKGIVY